MSGTPKLGSYDDLPGAPRTCCERYKTKEKCKCSNQAYPPCKYRTPHPNKCAWCAVASDRCRVSNPAQRACVCMLYSTVDSVVSPFPTLLHLFSMRSQPSLGLDADVRLPPKCPFTDRARDRGRGFERGRSESMVGTAAKGKGTGACAGGLCWGARVSDLLPCAHQC